MAKIVSAIAGLTHIEAGIRGSFLFRVLAKSENNELFFLRVTVYPQAAAFMPTAYVGKQNPKDDDEFDDTVSLMCEMLKRRKKVEVKRKDVEEHVAALIMGQGASFDEILAAMPAETLEAIHEKVKTALLAYHTDLLFTRPNNKRKRVYTETGFGQVFVDHLGGTKEFGADMMQSEINKFQKTYHGTLRVKLI